MADIRINSLPTTASASSSDDFLALDGATNGTRKLNAFSPTFGGNVTVSGTTGVTATDLTLGTSGPSVKASLSARAPRQGLVFDGSGTKATLTVPAFGTGDFTASAWVREDNSFAGTPIVMIGSGTGGFYMEFDANGFPYVAVQGGAGVQRKATTACVVKKLSLITYVKTSGTGIWYVNGIAAGSAADSNNYTGGIATLSDSSPYNLTGFLCPLIYNRALSAAEVVALYESGVPAGSDYNTASNTSVVTGFSNGGYTTFSGASATGFTAAAASGSNYVVNTPAGNTQPVLQVGSRVRVSFTATLTSGAAPTFGIRNNVGGDEGTFTVAAGSNSVIITMTQKSVSDGLGNAVFRSTGATSYAISNFSLTYLGLLLAPDAAQAGGGLTWYDTSGNAANITLPASGVSWNVPSSAKTATGWTFGGAINATGTSVLTAGYWRTKPTADDGTLTGLSLANSGGTQVGVADVNTLTGEIRVGGTSSAYYLSFYSKNSFVGNFGTNGELLLGTNGVNSSNGKLQLATHTTSAGGIGFGTDSWLYRDSAGLLTMGSAGNAVLKVDGAAGSVQGMIIAKGGSEVARISVIGSGSSLVLATTASVLPALTLDSSQRCILAGALRLNNAYVSGAPTATGYVTLQDSAGNTYKVLVGT